MANSVGPEIGCIVLAAGRSSRLGSPKALIKVGGESLISWIFFFTPRNIGQEGGYLIGDMEDRVIFDFMDEFFLP